MCVITSRSRAALARARALWNFWHTKLFEVKRGRTSGAACEGYFILKPLGATKVKGVSEPVNVYEVNGLGPLRTRLQRSAGRGLTKFIGRAREMEALEHAAELAKSGRGQIAAAMAEPGVGKSRLFFEFKAKNQSGWMVLETFSISHGKASAYLPVIDLLRNYFRIANEDDERTRREKVTGRVVALDRSLEDTLPYMFSLLGIVESVGMGECTRPGSCRKLSGWNCPVCF